MLLLNLNYPKFTYFFIFHLAFEGSSTTITSAPSMDVLDRHELNRQLGLTGSGKAGTFLSTILESEPNTSISALISTVDLEDNADDIPNEMIIDVMVSWRYEICCFGLVGFFFHYVSRR